MNSKKPVNVDSSSLLQLKAELFRKKQESTERHEPATEANRGRLRIGRKPLPDEYGCVSRRPVFSSSSTTKKRNTSHSTGGRDKDDVAEDREEEERQLRRARAILEAKSQLYDRLNNDSAAGASCETNRRFLVDFGDKPRHKPRSPSPPPPTLRPPPSQDAIRIGAHDAGETCRLRSDQWVHYVDSLGRNRTAPLCDVPAEYRHAAKPTTDDDVCGDGDAQPSVGPHQSDRHQHQQAEWQRRDAENAAKPDVHFEDVRFDEARTLGTGYYEFSRDAHVRRTQRETLDQLRDETEAQQARSHAARAKQRKALAQRLRKVRERKRLQLGLTIVYDELVSDDEEDAEAGSKSEAAAAEATEVDEEEGVSAEQRCRQEQEIAAAEERNRFVREWDQGKELLLKRVNAEPLSQSEWVAKQRDQRPGEFAPPSFYKQQLFTPGQRSDNIASTSGAGSRQSSAKCAADLSTNSTAVGSRVVSSTLQTDSAASTATTAAATSSTSGRGLDQSCQTNSSVTSATSVSQRSLYTDTSRPPPSLPPTSSAAPARSANRRNDMFKNSWIHTDGDNDNDDDEYYDHRRDNDARGGVSIEPPATAEYHGERVHRARIPPPSAISSSSAVASAMRQAIDEGLTALRQQSADKDRRTADL